MEKSGTEADAKPIEETSMNNNEKKYETKACKHLRELLAKRNESTEDKPVSLPKRNPDRDISRVGNQKIRLSPKRHDWNRDKVRWSIRSNNPITKPKH